MTHDKLILVYPKELLKDIKELKKEFSPYKDINNRRYFDFHTLSRNKKALQKMTELIDKFFNEHFEKKYINHYFEFDKSKFDPNIEQIANKNEKIWHELSLLKSSCDGCLELHNLPYHSMIYIQTLGDIRSDYNGNHGKYKAWYVKNGKLNNIFIPEFMRQDRNHNWYYSRSGGNYSFTHDLNCEFSLVRKTTYEKMEKENPKEYGKDQNSHRDYGFFNYTELS